MFFRPDGDTWRMKRYRLRRMHRKLAVIDARVAFVGGGYIAFEFAHVAARAGAEVTVLHRGERPLEGFAPDLVAQLVQATRDLGVDVRVRTAVTAVDKRGDGLVVHASSGEGKVEVAADLVVHAAGRVPEIDDLDLEAAGIAHAFLGHYHVPRDADRYTYPGNPDPLEFGERGERGAVLAEIGADGSIRRERRVVAVSEVHDLVVTLDGAAHMDEVERAIRELQRGLGEAAFARFRKLWASRRPNAVVPLDGTSCSACHAELRPSLVQNVRTLESLQYCDSCRRLLYDPEQFAAAS